jgi:hypothetical protein
LLVVPEEVHLLTSLQDEQIGYLLNGERLNALLQSLSIESAPTPNDTDSLSKKCAAMKILIKTIEDHGSQLIKLINPDSVAMPV